MLGRRSEIQDGGSVTRGECRSRHKGAGQQSTGSREVSSVFGPPSCPVAVVYFWVPLGYAGRHFLVLYLPGEEGGPVDINLFQMSNKKMDSSQEISDTNVQEILFDKKPSNKKSKKKELFLFSA